MGLHEFLRGALTHGGFFMSQRLTAVFTKFEDITHPRIERTRRHELFDLIVVALCGTIAGGDTCWR
jgi:hypothetical protein